MSTTVEKMNRLFRNQVGKELGRVEEPFIVASMRKALISKVKRGMANGEAPARGTAAAAASLRRRRGGGGSGNANNGGSGAASTMLQFYTDDTSGRRMSPNTVLIMSVGFIAVVSLLHVFGKLLR